MITLTYLLQVSVTQNDHTDTLVAGINDHTDTLVAGVNDHTDTLVAGVHNSE